MTSTAADTPSESAQGGVPNLSIGEVLNRLTPDFPDVSISKIRFLEAEGLVEPQRTASGYRKFSAADVDRLRYVLRAQRDHYLPLRVIREHLAALDRGLEPPPLPEVRPTVPDRPAEDVAAGQFVGAELDLRMSQRELLQAAAAPAGLLAALEEHGLVRPQSGPDGPQYTHDAYRITTLARQLHAYGIEPRHLRGVRIAADREAGLIEQAVRPLSRQRDADPKAAASELAALLVQLHLVILRGTMATAPAIERP